MLERMLKLKSRYAYVFSFEKACGRESPLYLHASMLNFGKQITLCIWTYTSLFIILFRSIERNVQETSKPELSERRFEFNTVIDLIWP